MNDRSSRAHTVFILTLTQTKTVPPPPTTTTGTSTNSSGDGSAGGGSGGVSAVVGEEETITRKSKFFLADLGMCSVYTYYMVFILCDNHNYILI